MRIDPRSQGTFFRAGTMLMVGAVCVLLIVYWAWVFTLRPSQLPPIVLEGAPGNLAKQIQARHFFGVSNAVAGPLVSSSDPPNLVLGGIISSGIAKRGVAVILVDGRKAVTATVGQEIMPDLVLSRVESDHVELIRRGQAFKLRLMRKK